MSNHILNVTKIKRDEDGDLVDYEYTIECPTGTCGWIECREEHPCEDHPGGWEEEDSDCKVCDPNFGDEHQFHDRDHEFMTFGWSVEYNGCCVRDGDCADVADIISFMLPGVGRYYVKDDWDEYCTLSLIGPVEAEGHS